VLVLGLRQGRMPAEGSSTRGVGALLDRSLERRSVEGRGIQIRGGELHRRMLLALLAKAWYCRRSRHQGSALV